MSTTYTTEELKQYIRTHLKNRYIEFFKNLILGYEPNEIIPVDAFEDMLKYKYPISPLDLVYIKRRIDSGSVTDQDRALYYKLKNIKEYTLDYNKSLQQSIKLIEDYHNKIDTPLGGILFHIYAYLVFDISAASDSYHFANMLSYMYTNDQKIRYDTVEEIPYRGVKRTSRITSNKIKKRWLQKAKDSGMIFERRKPTLHWLPKPIQKMSRKEAKERGYLR